jgi:hypothetical protein
MCSSCQVQYNNQHKTVWTFHFYLLTCIYKKLSSLSSKIQQLDLTILYVTEQVIMAHHQTV